MSLPKYNEVLSDTYRLRWMLNEEDNVIDIGLEGSIGIQNYMAVGWMEPKWEHDHMLKADIAVMGFDEEKWIEAVDCSATNQDLCRLSFDSLSNRPGECIQKSLVTHSESGCTSVPK
ncbi:hypothetical protein Tco_1573426, partial [Tanacetum coccineum]